MQGSVRHTMLFGLYTFVLMSTGVLGDNALAGMNDREFLYNAREALLLVGFLLYGVLSWRWHITHLESKNRVCPVLACATYAICSLVIQTSSLGPLLVIAVMTMALLVGLVGGSVYEKVAFLAANDSATRTLGEVVGIGGAFAVVAQYLLQLQFYVNWMFATLLVVCLCVLLHLMETTEPKHTKSVVTHHGGLNRTATRKRVRCLVVVTACIFLLYPFYEVVIRDAFNWTAFYQWHRLFLVVGYLAIGTAAFLGDRPAMSLVMAIMSLFAAFVLAQTALLQTDSFTTALFYTLLGATIAYGGISFMAIAPHAAHPAPVASASRIIEGVLTVAGGGVSAFVGGWPASFVLLAALTLIATTIAIMFFGGFFIPDGDVTPRIVAKEPDEEPPIDKEDSSLPSTPQADAIAIIARRYGLTPRETEVLYLVFRGLTAQQMADELVVTKSTVKFHITNLLKKTGTQSRRQMVEKLSAETEDLSTSALAGPNILPASD